MLPAHGGMRKPKTYRQGTFSSTGSRRVRWGGDKVAEVEGEHHFKLNPSWALQAERPCVQAPDQSFLTGPYLCRG